MKYKLFDVVKTEDGHTATIIEILDNNKYKIRKYYFQKIIL